MKMNKNIIYAGLGAIALAGCLGVNSGNPLEKKIKDVSSVNSSSSSTSEITSKVVENLPYKVRDCAPKRSLVSEYFLRSEDLATVSSRVYASATPITSASNLISSSIASINSGASNLGTLLNQEKPLLVLRYNNESSDGSVQLSNRRAVVLMNELEKEFEGKLNFAVYKHNKGEVVKKPFWSMRDAGLSANPTFLWFDSEDKKNETPDLYISNLTDNKSVSELYSDLHRLISE